MQRTGNILVVDYEPTIADLLIEILTDAGYIAYSMPPGAPALGEISIAPMNALNAIRLWAALIAFSWVGESGQFGHLR
jgi:CheY-like chemotaxis protein